MRLTYRDGRGRWCALVDGREVSGAIVERLAAYEETGLAPEEIEDVLHRFSQVLLETTNNRMSKTNYTLDAMLAEIEDARKEDCERYCELKQAQAEGRLGVLPCKVGDLLYEIDDDPKNGVIVCKVLWVDSYMGPAGHVEGNEQVNTHVCSVEVVDGHGKGSCYPLDRYDFGKTVFLSRKEAEAALEADVQGTSLREEGGAG